MAVSLSSCNQTNPSSSSSNTDSNTNSESSNQNVISSWKAEDVATMVEFLGEEIPVAPFTSNYTSAMDVDDAGEYFYLCDENSADFSLQYVEILKANQYELYDDMYEEEGIYLYCKDLGENHYVVVQCDYFAGSDEFQPCMEIYAWPEIATPSGDLEDWDADTKALMQDYLGMELPVAPFTNNYEVSCFEDEDGRIFYVYDENCGNVVEAYGVLLQAAGFVYYTTEDDADFYLIAVTETTYVMVQVDYFTGNDMFAACTEIYAWIIESTPAETYTSWPTELVEKEVSSLGIQIPAFVGGEEYQLESYSTDENVSFMVSVTGVDETALSTYQTVLENASWVVTAEDDGSYSAIDPSGKYVLYFYLDEGIFCVYFDDYTSAPALTWPSETVLSVLGVDIPHYEGTTYQTNITGNMLTILVSTDKENCESEYQTILETVEWLVDNSDYETIGYYALNNDASLEMTFYYSNGYLVISVMKAISLEDAVSVHITPSAFSSTKYADNDGNHQVDNFSFSTSNVMNQNGNIQIKKNIGLLYNTEALNLVSVEITNGSATLVVYGCSAAGDYSNGEIISGNNGVYDLTGYSYFCIMATPNVGTMSELIVTYA